MDRVPTDRALLTRESVALLICAQMMAQAESYLMRLPTDCNSYQVRTTCKYILARQADPRLNLEVEAGTGVLPMHSHIRWALMVFSSLYVYQSHEIADSRCRGEN
jgi:hypothetical protein